MTMGSQLDGDGWMVIYLILINKMMKVSVRYDLNFVKPIGYSQNIF